MRKRINKNMLLISLTSILLLSGLLSLIFYGFFNGQVRAEIKDRTVMLADLLDHGGNASIFTGGYEIGRKSDVRITIVAPDGSVRFDSEVDTGTLENHGSRKEIVDAQQFGVGQNERVSGTLGVTTYYYAVRLADGSALRLSRSLKSILSVYGSILPAVIAVALLILLLTDIFARKLTDKIIKPINEIDLEHGSVAVYDELVPFARKIERQSEHIEEQIDTLNKWAYTLKTITSGMKEGLILLDGKGIVISINVSAAALFGLNETAEGRNILEITRNAAILEHFKQALNGVNSEVTLEMSGRTEQLYFSASGSGVLILILDITEKMKADRLRKEFTANVSHELKTPLTAISGFAEMLQNGMAKAEDSAEFAGRIKEEAARLLTLIDDIIMLSELDEKSALKETDHFDIRLLAVEVLESLRPKASKDGISLDLKCSVGSVKANRQMIFELLYNLIDNGIKYNKPNGKVTVAISADKGKTKIVVADTGIGIPSEHIGRVFERFYRVDKSRSKKTGGTGLGLSIVKHIAAWHGGTAEIESREGEGTAVTVKLQA